MAKCEHYEGIKARLDASDVNENRMCARLDKIFDRIFKATLAVIIAFVGLAGTVYIAGRSPDPNIKRLADILAENSQARQEIIATIQDRVEK